MFFNLEFIVVIVFISFILLQYKKNLVKEFTNLSLPLFEDGTFKPIIHAVMSLDNIRQAHEMMEANINIGKIVLTVNRNEGKEEL